MSAQPHPALVDRVMPPEGRSVLRQDDDERTSDLDFDDPTQQFDDEVPAASVRAPPPPSTPAMSEAPPARPMSVAPGTVLRERYLLQQVVGTGGTSMVYRAQDLRHEVSEASRRIIAVKLLHEELREDARAIERLKREFAQMQLLAHPSVLKVFDVDVDRGVWFMTMELLEGQSLSMYLRTHRSAHPQALDIVKACGEALQFAHERGIVHGDLKPGNIFLTSGGVRVLDFIGAGEDTRSDRAATPAYASLQRLAGELPDVSDDIYSLGCVAYEVLSGVHPFDRKPASVAHELGLQPARISSLSYRQWRILDRALAFDRRDRPESMRAFLDALLHQDSPAANAPTVATPTAEIIPVALPAAVLATPPESTADPVNAALSTSSVARLDSSAVPASETTFVWRNREPLLKPIADLNAATSAELPPVFEQPRRRGIIPAFVVLLLAALATWFAQSEFDSPRQPDSAAQRSARPVAKAPVTTAAVPPATQSSPAQASTPPQTVQSQAAPPSVAPSAVVANKQVAPSAVSSKQIARQSTDTAKVKPAATAKAPPAGVGFVTSRVSVSERSVAAVIQVKRLDASTTGRIPVRWRTEKRSAKPGEDYVEVTSGTLILQDGQRMGAIYVPIVNDDKPEADETFVVELLDTSKATAREIGTAIVTIRDDDRALLSKSAD